MGIKGELVKEQVVAETIGFVSGVEGGGDIAATASEGALFGLTDSGHVFGGMQTDQIEGVAQTGVALLGDVANPAEIARFLGDDIESGKGPDFGGGHKALRIAQMSQLESGQ